MLSEISSEPMGVPMPPVLVVDDEQSMREFLGIMLKKSDYDYETVADGARAIELLEEGRRFSVVLTDLKMPEVGGLEVLERVKALDPSCQVVVMTAFATAETALSALKTGAYDYLTKPFKVDEIQAVLERAVEKYELVSENLYLKKELQQRDGFADLIGKSKPMRRVYDLITRVAPTPTTVLVTGESGTGKELVARAIHRHSDRSDGPFVPINCGAIPENLIESELFGHVKGAFTGASADKEGVFAAASGGTLFLDEVGELPLNTQVRFLRVLQEKRVKPVGGARELPIDCRILAATNRDLGEDVEEGEFRKDLYYRLNVIQIDLPPLRERGEDIRLLIEHYVRRYAERLGRPIEGVEAEAMRTLLDYEYPGNVRELQNIVERAVTLETDGLIGSDVLPYHLQEDSVARVARDIEIPEEGLDLEKMVARLERTLISRALERTEGVKKDAAKLLGISFRSLRYRLDKYDGAEEFEG
jgi:two-component system response regulator PilR (NtrC family)